MKTVLFFFCSCSLAFCQEAEDGNFVHIPDYVQLLPKDYFAPPPAQPTKGYQVQPYGFERKLFESYNKSGNDRYAGAGRAVAPEAIRMELNAVRHNYEPKLQGSFLSRFAYALGKAPETFGEDNYAIAYYQELGGMANNPQALYNYNRDHDPLFWLLRGLQHSGQKALIGEFIIPEAKKLAKPLLPGWLYKKIVK